MSDESSDETFASADEGSGNEYSFMKSPHVDPSGHDQDLVPSLVDVIPTKNSNLTRDNQPSIVCDEGVLVSVSNQKDTEAGIHEFAPPSTPCDINQEEVLQCHTEATASDDVTYPFLNLEEKPKSVVTNFGEVIKAEGLQFKDGELDVNKNTEALDPKDNLCVDPERANTRTLIELTEASPYAIESGDSVDRTHSTMIGDSVATNVADVWDLDDLWESLQTSDTGVASSEVGKASSDDVESQDRVNLTDSKKVVESASGNKTDWWNRSMDGSQPIFPALDSETCPMMITESQGPRGFLYSEKVQKKCKDSKTSEDGVWGSGADQWTGLKSSKAENSLTVNSETVPTVSIQQEKRSFESEVQGKISGPLSVEEVDAWDLEDDPWLCSDPTEPDTCLVPDTAKNCGTVSTPKVTKAGLSMKVEESWGSVEDFQTKRSTVNASQELASAATALVKSVGGGLASFVGSFKLSNLSSTFAAFEEKSLTKPVGDEQQQKSPQPEASKNPGDYGVGSTPEGDETNGGWGGWDLGSLAKSLTSTVENTGLQIIHGGVDVLEQIGRKTFTALKENDPGLAYTKSFLRPTNDSQGSKLSQMLREACDQHAAQSDELLAGQLEARRGDLAFQLESRLALVHMEALELLSSRASARLGTKLARLEAPHNIDDVEEYHRSVRSLTGEGGVLERIWQTLQLKNQEEEEGEERGAGEGNSVSTTAIVTAVAALEVVTPGSALLKKCEEVQQKCEHFDPSLPMTEIFYQAVEGLADLTSVILAYLHKLAECLLLLGPNRERFNAGFLDIAEKVASIITAAKRRNDTLCSAYVGHLKRAASDMSTKEEVGAEGALTTNRRLVANLFLETGMANGYLDDAASNYLVPVLQIACLEAFFPESTSTPASCHPPSSMKVKQR
ncbi:unnamed protein product [Hydatigera taeniaeformis]|uniref:Protein FAM114A2 n=1 Tax=Hydatigena taeniaeformis TaxID=6205 RepID=A0A0R3X1J5_HYDTA|nr:unnamed protein product [Hydatigera taeniaeformis]